MLQSTAQDYSVGHKEQAKARHRARTRRDPARGAAQKTGKELWDSEPSVTEGVLVTDTMSQLTSCLKATVGRTVFKITDDPRIPRSLPSTATEVTSFIPIHQEIHSQRRAWKQNYKQDVILFLKKPMAKLEGRLSGYWM